MKQDYCTRERKTVIVQIPSIEPIKLKQLKKYYFIVIILFMKRI